MTTYTGGCHCGKIAFDVDVDADIEKALACNCSMCGKRGGLLTFVPAERMRLRTSEADLSTYTFNTHRIRHQFCPVCGIAPFARASDRSGNPTVAINVRCLEGVDPQKLEVQHYDGRAL